MLECFHCGRSVPGTSPVPNRRRPICDGCVESIRTTRRPLDPLAQPTPPRARKPRKGNRRLRPAVRAVLWLLIAGLFTGCGATWSGEFEMAFDPAPLLELQKAAPGPVLQYLHERLDHDAQPTTETD